MDATIPRAVGEFNRLIGTLLAKLVSKHPNDARLLRAKKRFLLAKDVLPTLIIENAGFYLHKYRETIKSEDGETIAAMTEANFFDREFDAIDGEEELKDEVKNILPMVQRSVSSLAENEREVYYRVVRKLLDIYDRYASMVAR
ncbi:MAG: hypothetical protein P1U53_11140 [Sulfitobacter sp.]|nr:hypothetical protein [Sulfitobacter sp.]